MAVGYKDYIAQDLLRVQDVLRKEYLPFLDNALNVAPSPFLEKIKKSTLTASAGEYGARIGIGGGFGMSAERSATPSAYAPLYTKLTYTSKDAYNDIKISHKDIMLARNNTGALLNTVQDNMEAAYEASKWNTARMLFGDGTGVLCKLTASKASASTSIVVDDTTKLIEGLVVDIYAPAGTSASTAAAQIVAIDHPNKTVTLSKGLTSALTTASSDVYGFVTVQGSYNREITGLASIFDHTAVTSIYGITKSTNPWVKPYTVSAAHDIDDTKITNAIRMAEKRNGKIDMLLCGPTAYEQYEYYMKESANNITVVSNRQFKGGATGYEIQFGNRTAVVVCENFVPANKIWGVDTSMFELRQTGWDFAAHESSIWTLMPDTSVYRALLANYMELICKNPGSCIEITDVDSGS